MKVQYLRAKIFGLVVFFVACFGIFLYLYKDAGGRFPFANRYTISTQVLNAFQLVPNADVRAAGVKIGVVDDITNIGSTAKVNIDIDKKYRPVYKDAKVQIRTKTLVGENYLDIQPGTPRAGALPNHGALPLANAQDTVQLDQILSSFDPVTRRRVQQDFKVFAQGLQGRGGDFNNMLGALSPTFQNTGQVMGVLKGQRQQVAQLVDQFGQVMKSFADRTDAVRLLSNAAKTTAVAVSARDQALQDAFNALPSFLDQTRTSTARLGSFSTRATPVIANLDTASRYLAPAIRDLQPAAAGTRTLVRLLPGFVNAANPLFDKLSGFSTAANPAIQGLDATLRQVNPFLTYLSPYQQEFGSFFGNVGSAVDSVDAVGHLGRVMPIVSANSYANTTPAESALIHALADQALLSLPVHVGNNAYPHAGTLANPQPFDGNYPHVNASP